MKYDVKHTTSLREVFFLTYLEEKKFKCLNNLFCEIHTKRKSFAFNTSFDTDDQHSIPLLNVLFTRKNAKACYSYLMYDFSDLKSGTLFKTH